MVVLAPAGTSGPCEVRLAPALSHWASGVSQGSFETMNISAKDHQIKEPRDS